MKKNWKNYKVSFVRFTFLHQNFKEHLAFKVKPKDMIKVLSFSMIMIFASLSTVEA
jgi:hypothetical protein